MDDYNIIRSRLSRKITREGTTLEVLIYRVEGKKPGKLIVEIKEQE